LANNRNRLTLLGNTSDSLSGFTLLEVVIAMAIMVLPFASILAVEQGSINASAKAKQMNIVDMLARNQMVETEFKIEGKTFTEVKKEESGTFPEPYSDYRWKTVIKEIEFPKIGTGAAPGSQGQNQSAELLTKLITNFLSKAIREVTVTVSWRRGSGEQSYSVATYWVDLNYEFKITE
jgi:prepilin-type N-terminal cleavage/methylation domain-containing protein